MRAVLATSLLLLGVTQQAEAGVGAVIGALLAKANEIVSECGSKIVSGYRPGARVAGTRRMSLHASGHAVDMQGNPACIYRVLNGWPGGYSTDYRAVNHVHISLFGREDGRRFTHHIGRRHARHHHGRHHRQHRRA